MADESEILSNFNFRVHGESAAAEYRKIRPLYENFAMESRKIILAFLQDAHIKYHSIEARAKEVDEFGKKAAKFLESDPTKPKYPNPLNDITDMAGVRIITFLPRTVGEVCNIVEKEFEIIERVDKAANLMDEGKIGYQSVHYLVKIRPSDKFMSEYELYRNLTLEVQIRTILQHAWAEMEHDIQYKGEVEIPRLIKRKFIALAGLLDIADREFQTLQDDYEQKKKQKENELARYMNNSLKTSDRDYIMESLKEIGLWIDTERFREILLDKENELNEDKERLDQLFKNMMSRIGSNDNKI
jgi:ppGpp synthetase/RelA/SpoT-type nucleotidyltranferase